MDIGQYIIDKIKLLLNEPEMNQERLATKIGVHRVDISRIASGKRGLNWEFVQKFLSAYPVNIIESKNDLPFVSESMVNYYSKPQPDARAVPFFSFDVNDTQKVPENDIIMIPGFEDCDRWEVVFNRDLMPDFMPGEIIGLVRTDEQEPILWDKPYVVKLKGLNLLRIPRESARGTEFVDLTSPQMAVITLKRADIIMYLIKGKITKYM